MESVCTLHQNYKAYKEIKKRVNECNIVDMLKKVQYYNV